MKALLFILAGLLGSYYFTDIRSENSFYSVLCPVGVFLFLLLLMLWVAQRKAAGARDHSSGDSGAGFISPSNDCSDDGGCGD